MDLKGILELIENEFKVIKKEDGIICVAPVNGESYPETTIKLTLDEGRNQYELFEVIRGREYQVDTFTDKYNSVLALYIFSKSKLEVRNYDTNFQNDIESAKTLNDIQNIFKDNHEVQHYTFFELKPNKIILEKSTNDRYNILFLGKNGSKVYIDKARNLSSAAGVLYNFSFKLSQFYDLINRDEIKTDSDFTETLKELYLLG